MSPTASNFPKGNQRKLLACFFGVLFGFVLSRLGFTDYDEVHKMFVFSDLRLFLIFCGGVVFTGVGMIIFRKRSTLPKNPIHRGSIIGGVTFGAGWALTGACPGVVFAQLGEGQVVALFTLAGAAVGAIGYRFAHARWFQWDRGSCG
jgi:uncharacterized membrane protein YedE/YeeE